VGANSPAKTISANLRNCLEQWQILANQKFIWELANPVFRRKVSAYARKDQRLNPRLVPPDRVLKNSAVPIRYFSGRPLTASTAAASGWMARGERNNESRAQCRAHRVSANATGAGRAFRSDKAEGFPGRLPSEARVFGRDTAARLNLQEIAGVLFSPCSAFKSLR
jgi:hypothetical protein